MRKLKLSTVVVGIILAFFVGGVCFAASGTNCCSDYVIANNLMNSRKFVEAQIAYNEVIKIYNSEEFWVRKSHGGLAFTLFLMGKFDEAKAESLKIISLYSNIDKDECAMALYRLAQMSKKFSEKEVYYDRIIKEYPSAKKICVLALSLKAVGIVYYSDRLSEAVSAIDLARSNYMDADKPQLLRAERIVGLELYKAKLFVLANKVLVNFIMDDANTDKPANLEEAFSKITPSVMQFDEYKNILQNILKVVPASEVNAPFLGKVKSELEKVK